MSRDELIERVTELAKEAKAADLLACAGVLLTLSGALHMGTERALLAKCSEHAVADLANIARARASLN